MNEIEAALVAWAAVSAAYFAAFAALVQILRFLSRP